MKSRLESCMERSLMKMPLSYRSSGLSMLGRDRKYDLGPNSHLWQVLG